MGHDIRLRDVQVGTEVAWHKLTTVVENINADNCGILYGMEKQRVFLENGTPTDYFICVTQDDCLPVGAPVGKQYALIPNEMIWNAVQDALSGVDHKIVSVGTIGSREHGFISVKLSEDQNAAGRDTRSTLNIVWGHGGAGGKVLAKSGFTVIVCRNTYNMALSERGDWQFYVTHKGQAQIRLNNMSGAIENHYRVSNEFLEAMNRMHNIGMSSDDAKQFFAGFIVPKYEAKDEISTRASNQFKELHRLFHVGKGNNGETHADAFNAITDYYTHQSSGGDNNPQRQFESSEFGGSQKRKQQAFILLDGGKTSLGDLGEVIKRGDRVLQAV